MVCYKFIFKIFARISWQTFFFGKSLIIIEFKKNIVGY